MVQLLYHVSNFLTSVCKHVNPNHYYKMFSLCNTRAKTNHIDSTRPAPLSMHNLTTEYWNSNAIWNSVINITKCELLSVTNSPHSSTYHYKLNDYIIQRVQSIKLLGPTISHNLSWSSHISKIVSKVNQVQSFL